MKWLVTGGCGFVGSNLADELLSKGEEVVILDSLVRLGSRDNLAWLRSRHGLGWRFLQGDTRDASLLEKLVIETKPAALAHLAGQVAATTSLEQPRMDFEVNALGALNVLEAVRLKSPGTVILFCPPTRSMDRWSNSIIGRQRRAMRQWDMRRALTNRFSLMVQLLMVAQSLPRILTVEITIGFMAFKRLCSDTPQCMEEGNLQLTIKAGLAGSAARPWNWLH